MMSVTHAAELYAIENRSQHFTPCLLDAVNRVFDILLPALTVTHHQQSTVTEFRQSNCVRQNPYGRHTTKVLKQWWLHLMQDRGFSRLT